MISPPRRIAVVAAETEPARAALGELCRIYPCVDPERAEVIIPLGGDGFMLETLHRFLPTGVPIYGMHRGSVGFLMNAYRADGLYERLAAAQPVVQMCNRQLPPMWRRKLVQYRQQNHRIQPARNRDKDCLSRLKELTALDGLFDVVQKITHKWCSAATQAPTRPGCDD